jgi:hypothetical protein
MQHDATKLYKNLRKFCGIFKKPIETIEKGFYRKSYEILI